MLLKDKICIVSGVGPGMGGELAQLIVKEGGIAVLAARTRGSLEGVEQQLYQINKKAEFLSVQTDITIAEQCDALIGKTLDKYGQIDCLFNNAYHPGEFELIENTNFYSWQEALNVNLFGSISMSQKVLPAMKKQRQGVIIMSNTMATRKPMLTHAGYAASKAALASATAHLAQEVGQYGIRVNSVFIGWMWGPGVEIYCMMKAQEKQCSPEEIRADIAGNIALGDIPDDADCAKAAIMLASDYAAAVTGASLDVNGGEFFVH